MKKIVLFAALVFFGAVVLTLSSCKTTEQCPAYGGSY